MNIIPVVVLVALPLFVICSSLAIGFVMVRRFNEVSTRHRVGAPLRWMVTPTPLGRLHRRLRSAVRLMRAEMPKTRRRDRGLIDELADDTELLAAATGRELVASAHLPIGSRAAILRELQARVVTVERLTDELLAMTSGPNRFPSRADWERHANVVASRLTMLREARTEISDLERNGVR